MYGGLISFVIGWQSVFTGAVHNLQRLWIHMFLATNYLPSNFKVTLSGLSIVQNLPFLPLRTQTNIVNKLLPDNYFSSCPVAYIQYYRDVSFARNIYQVVFFVILLALVFGVLTILYRTVRWLRDSKVWLYRYYNYLTNRPYWLIDSLVYFQYIAVMYAIFAQFLDIAP
jgi:hypothetical protein